VTHQTKVGIGVMLLSLSTCGLGVLLLPYADFPRTMGWMLIGCGAFGLLLGLGVTFWVDRSDESPGTKGPRA
jgi:hypothetical protein